ncbi:retrovirus-related Pol polyprotein from transposon 412 [Trichonephila clavipes]|nr:retrovirus-related Pol polyprotein from transposon 412 [Trichonephila clavipes]
MFGPSNSPEMSLVEYLWFHQENRICDATLPPRNVWEYYDQLKTASTSDNSSTPYRVNALPAVDGFERKSAKLYQLLKNLLAPDIPSDQTLDKLKDALKKHLTPKPLIIPSRHKFLNRKQTEGEGISTYIAELRALAMNWDYDKDMLNIMLRDVFVSGLRDKMILDRLFEEDNINLEKTLNIALAMEKAFKGTNDIMGRAINSMQTFKKHMDKNPILQKAERKHYIVHDAQVPTMQKRIVDLFQINVISVGKLGTLNRHASHLKRQMQNRLNKNRVRTVPFALKGRVENEIDRLEKEGIIEKVDSSEWATPVVPVVKSDGSIRLYVLIIQ